MLIPELEHLDAEGLRGAFEGPPLDGEEYAVTYYDEVAILLRKRGGDAGVAYLLEALSTIDPVRKGSIFLALTMPPALDTTEVRDLLRRHLSDGHRRVLTSAIKALASLPPTASERATVLAMRQHGDPYVRAAVLEYRARNDKTDAVAAAMLALRDPEAVVRETAIDVLDEADAANEELIRPFLNDESEGVRRAAAWALGDDTDSR